MKLAERKVSYNYNAYDLLSSMVSVGNVNYERMCDNKQMEMIGFVHFWNEFMPRFTFGRQTGQTTAIREYMTVNENVLVITKNRQLVDMLYGRDNKRVGAISQEIHFLSKSYRGLKPNEIFVFNYEIDTIIFDTCSRRDICKFLQELSTLCSIQNGIKSMVSVGETN